MAHRMSRCRDKEYTPVLCNRLRGRKRACHGSIHVNQIRFEPCRPALGKRATDDFPFETPGSLVGFPPGDDSGMRKMIEPPGVIVMEMGQK